MKRINISVEDEFLNKLDNYCKKNFTNRSQFITQCVYTVISQQESLEVIKEFNYLMKKLSLNNSLDEEDKKRLDALSMLLESNDLLVTQK